MIGFEVLLRSCWKVRVQPALKSPAEDDQVQSGSFHGSHASMTLLVAGCAWAAATILSTRASQSVQPPQLYGKPS